VNHPHTRQERLEAIREIADNLDISFCEAARIYNGAVVTLADGVSAQSVEHGRTTYDDSPFTIIDINLE